MERIIQSLLQKVETMMIEHSNLESLVQGHGTRISNLEKSIESFLMDDVVPDSGPLNSMHRLSEGDINRLLRRLENQEAKTANHEVLLVESNSMIQGQSKEIKRLEMQLRNANDEIRKLQRRMESLEHTLSLRNVVAAELEEHVRQQEFSSFDGVLIRKITGFAKRQNDAKTGKQVSVNSPCFYTSRHGYKMRARIYLNGDGTGRNSSSFQRPKRESNILSGCPTFCPLSELSNHAYVRDYTMFIKVIVDTTDV